jgi:hypothetical protein
MRARNRLTAVEPSYLPSEGRVLLDLRWIVSRLTLDAADIELRSMRNDEEIPRLHHSNETPHVPRCNSRAAQGFVAIVIVATNDIPKGFPLEVRVQEIPRVAPPNYRFTVPQRFLDAVDTAGCDPQNERLVGLLHVLSSACRTKKLNCAPST